MKLAIWLAYFSKCGQAIAEAMRVFGLTKWVAPLSAVAVLTYVAYLFGAFVKRKK